MLAIITGNGQDTAHLSSFLLKKNYEVVIATRRSGSNDNWRLKEEGIFHHPNLKIEYCDFTEQYVVNELLLKYKPDELYHLAAQSFVQSSFNHVHTTFNSNTLGYINILESVKNNKLPTKIYFASSSEMFGKVQETPQTETTPFYPRSPYGVSKLASYWMGKNYRESFGMFIANGILFNHEGIYRGEEFITRKISLAMAHLHQAYDNEETPVPLVVGNMYSQRDWGSSKDYVKGMWMMLQHDVPDDFVLATNKTYSVKDFIDEAYYSITGGILAWVGEGLDEKAIDSNDNVIVKISKEFYRPAEVDMLLGDYTKANDILGWSPATTFSRLVKEMVDKDIERLEKNI